MPPHPIQGFFYVFVFEHNSAHKLCMQKMQKEKPGADEKNFYSVTIIEYKIPFT